MLILNLETEFDEQWYILASSIEKSVVESALVQNIANEISGEAGIETTTKHLPGRHLQRSHAGHIDTGTIGLEKENQLTSKLKHAAKENPKVRDLANRLTTIGGNHAIISPKDKDLSDVLENGTLSYSPRAVRQYAKLTDYLTKPGKYNVNVGYYLRADDGVWRKHMWLSDAKGNAYEPEDSLAVAYYGVQLPKWDAAERLSRVIVEKAFITEMELRRKGTNILLREDLGGREDVKIWWAPNLAKYVVMCPQELVDTIAKKLEGQGIELSKDVQPDDYAAYLVYPTMKHLPTRHDQKKHGRHVVSDLSDYGIGGEHFGSVEGLDNEIVDVFEIDKLPKDSKKLASTRLMHSTKTGAVYFSSNAIVHVTMADIVAEELDDLVRLRMNADGKLIANIREAGVIGSGEYRMFFDERQQNKALKNIYRTFDKLVEMGLDPLTQVNIQTESGVIDSTLKSLVEKHLPTRHDQKKHGRPGVGLNENEGYGGGGIDTGGGLRVSHHIKRVTVGEEIVRKVLKNGEVRERKVPVYEFTDSVTGNKITDEAELARLRKAVSPNAFDVMINPDPHSHIVAVWKDAKGRPKTAYSPEHDKGGLESKFERLKKFNEALPKIRRRIKQDMQSTDAKTREAVEILYLIDKTGFRIGSNVNTLAAQQAYGASTLLGKHVSVDGNKVTFDFIGKGGKSVKKSIRNELLAKIISSHKTSNWSQPLFSIDSGRVRGYLKEIAGEFKVHDFRTWNATDKALNLINGRKGPASSEKIFKAWQKEVAAKVGKQLGNTAGVALSNYIDPHVWDIWRKPEWGQWLPPKLKNVGQDE